MSPSVVLVAAASADLSPIGGLLAVLNKVNGCRDAGHGHESTHVHPIGGGVLIHKACLHIELGCLQHCDVRVSDEFRHDTPTHAPTHPLTDPGICLAFCSPIM
jgi:hypothetical protein